MRLVLTYLLPLVLPTAFYLIWLFVLRPRRAAAAGQAPELQDVPWLWLALAGAVLALIVMFGGAVLRGDGDDRSGYSPAYIDERGRIVPGRFD